MDNKLNKEQRLTSRPKQQQSLTPTDAAGWMFSAYPLLSKRKQSISSLYAAVKEQTKSLSEIDAHFHEQITLKWIKAQLIEVLTFCGAFGNVTDTQVILTARYIRNKFFYLTPAELTYFFETFIGGGYGMLYVGKTINPQTILQAVRNFDEDVINKRGEVSNEEEEARHEEERRLIEEGKTGIGAWLMYCKEHGIEGQPIPMKRALKEIQRKIILNK